MKKWIGIVSSLMLCTTAVFAQWQSIHTWDMNDNGRYQLSDNGMNLGGHYDTNLHQFAQIPDDGTFIFAPTNVPLGQGFTGKTTLDAPAPIDLTAGLVRMTFEFTEINWTNNPTDNNTIGIRLYEYDDGNTGQAEYIGFRILDNSDVPRVRLDNSTAMGGLAANYGRYRGDPDFLHPVGNFSAVVEIDYDGNEIRLSGDFEWFPGSVGPVQVITNIDFAAAGFTSISNIQTYYQNWSSNDYVVVDTFKIEQYILPPAGVYIAEKSAVYELKNLPVTNTFASLAVQAGDFVAVQCGINKAFDTDSISFSGDAVLGSVNVGEASQGARAIAWYAPVISNGTVNVTLVATNVVEGGVTNKPGFAPFVAYTVRASNGDVDVLTSSAATAPTNALGEFQLVTTNVYEFGAVITNGLLLEASSTYADSIATDNLDYEQDGNQGPDKRIAGHIFFSGVSGITNIWTATTYNKQAAVFGLAFVQGNGTDAVPVTDFSILSVSGDTATLYWTGLLGQTYSVEYKTDLAAATWTPDAGNTGLPGVDGGQSTTSTVAGDAVFYQIVSEE